MPTIYGDIPLSNPQGNGTDDMQGQRCGLQRMMRDTHKNACGRFVGGKIIQTYPASRQTHKDLRVALYIIMATRTYIPRLCSCAKFYLVSFQKSSLIYSDIPLTNPQFSGTDGLRKCHHIHVNIYSVTLRSLCFRLDTIPVWMIFPPTHCKKFCVHPPSFA